MRNWLPVVLVFLALFAVMAGSAASDWSTLRSPADDAKLHAILDSVGVTEPYAAQIRKSMTDSEAKDLLWQAFEAIHDKHGYADGLEALKKVLAFNPYFGASWWPDKKVETHAIAELSGVLYDTGDWEKARPAVEWVDRMIHLENPAADTFAVPVIEKCREKLVEAGKSDFPPYVIVNDTPTDDQSTMVDGVVVVPASQFASYSGLSLTVATDGKVTIASSGHGVKRLALTAGQCRAEGTAGAVNLPVPPQQMGDDVLIPVRAVAEYFGYKVTWKPIPKMAWVSAE